MSTHQRYVLVVEDDASMSLAIERLLRAAGFKAITFPSAEAFLASDKALTAACLVLDISLPGLSGFDLGRRLNETGFSAPVIFITAHDRPSAREQAKEAGAVAYLPKPFVGLGQGGDAIVRQITVIAENWGDSIDKPGRRFSSQAIRFKIWLRASHLHICLHRADHHDGIDVLCVPLPQRFTRRWKLELFGCVKSYQVVS